MMVLLCALAMSVGWGFRGDYGHEAGAMVPGALLGLAVALASGREDWRRRGSILALLGAAGWAIGGQMSYGMVVGYTAHTSLPDVAYGYACLFAIGALWGGIGAGILALGVTQPRSALESFAGPLIAVYVAWKVIDWCGVTGRLDALAEGGVLHDADWVAASSALVVVALYALAAPRARKACAWIAILAAGWWVGYALFRVIPGWRMTPPRSDNWAGCLGLAAALLAGHLRSRNRTAVMLTCHGLVAGGFGFAVADFVNMLGRAQWGPIGRYQALQGLDYWKWMEQLFGLVMGWGVALGFRRLVRGGLAPAEEDRPPGLLSHVAPLFLLTAMLWENFFKNVRNWLEHGQLGEELFGLGPAWWFFLIGALLVTIIIVAASRHRRGALPLAPASALGRAQLLFLLVLWMSVAAAFTQAFPGMARKGILLIHVTFWLTAGACTLIVLALREEPGAAAATARPAGDRAWLPGRRHWLLWALVPLVCLLLAQLSVSSHAEPLYGSHRRFESGPGQ